MSFYRDIEKIEESKFLFLQICTIHLKAAGSFGQFVFSPLAGGMIQGIGWQNTAFLFLAIVLIYMILIPILVFFFLKDSDLIIGWSMSFATIPSDTRCPGPCDRSAAPYPPRSELPLGCELP